MEYIRHGDCIAVRLDPGDDLLDNVQELIEAENIEDAVIVSGIGTFDRCVLHFVDTVNTPPSMVDKTWEDIPLEVNGIQGIIANGTYHIHATVSTEERAWCGHVKPGCRTLYLCELFIQVLKGFELDRKPKEHYGSVRVLTSR